MSWDALKAENKYLIQHLKGEMRKRIIAEQKLANAVRMIYEDRKPEIQRAVLPFARTVVAPAASISLNMRPEEVLASIEAGEGLPGVALLRADSLFSCTPERLVMVSDHFDVECLQIGRNQVLPMNNNRMSGALFKGDLNRIEMNDAPLLMSTTCEPGQIISLVVINTSNAPQEIDAALVVMLNDFEIEPPDPKEVEFDLEKELAKLKR